MIVLVLTLSVTVHFLASPRASASIPENVWVPSLVVHQQQSPFRHGKY